MKEHLRTRALLGGRSLSCLGGVLLSVVLAAPASASDKSESVNRRAAKHFQHAVELYDESDFRAALVEFRHAYALLPNAAVLYNIGQTQYQLQDYAGALSSFTRFWDEAGAADVHRREVQNDLAALRTRVGYLTVTSSPSGAEIEIDDEPAGSTPFAEQLKVSVGKRKVSASLPGRPPITRYVEVGAGEQASVYFPLRLAGEESPTAPWPWDDAPVSPPSHSVALLAAGWIGSALLAAGAGTFGALALQQSAKLRDARTLYPMSDSTLSHEANLTMTYSVLADSLAGAALLLGGVTLFATLSSGKTSPIGKSSGVQVGFGLGSARLSTTF